MPAGASLPEPPDEVITLELYLTAIPEAVRQSLKRPDDPSGTTVPVTFALNNADDVLKLLPPRPPRFRPGVPLPGMAGWVLDRLLGTGGFGEVWFARHVRMASLSGAVKFCFGQSGQDLNHEAELIDRVMAAGKHPNIVPVLHAHLDGDSPWLMFEYVGGGTLTDWIHQLTGKPKDERLKQVLGAMKQLCEAVGHFHALPIPIVHRDLKPSNILLDKSNGRLRITDFGIGSITSREANRQESRGRGTRGGRLLTYMRGSHTPLYSSPQQRSGADPDPRDDVHALGVIAYQMLTGHMAQGAGPDFADDLREAGANKKLIDLLGKCVAQKSERRPRDAMEMLALLPVVRTGKADGASSQTYRKTKLVEARDLPDARYDLFAHPVETEPQETSSVPLSAAMPSPSTPATEVTPLTAVTPLVIPPARKTGDKLDLTLPGGIAMTFAWCPPGNFLMGSEMGVKLAKGNQFVFESELPVHRVEISRGYYFGIHPVTCNQFSRFIEETNYKTEAELEGGGIRLSVGNSIVDNTISWRAPGFPQTSSHPVTVVNWHDVEQFLLWLSRVTQRTVRLPTEAEREYASRAGSSTEYHFGDQASSDLMNYDGNYKWNRSQRGLCREGTTQVGLFPPNAWGICDVHGNVWEWCEDWYDELYYQRSPAINPVCKDGDKQYRVCRGGFWRAHPAACRSASRHNNEPQARTNYLGFRVVFNPD